MTVRDFAALAGRASDGPSLARPTNVLPIRAPRFTETLAMVYLSRIYTKAGDRGETGLGDGTRVPKDHPRVAAYGEVDELNAVLGLLHAYCPDAPEREALRAVQNDLFDVGADLCVPGGEGLRV